MDADGNRAAVHELARARAGDPQAKRIRRKKFSSMDKKIKVGRNAMISHIHGYLLLLSANKSWIYAFGVLDRFIGYVPVLTFD